jgi:hypothetical protein
MNISEEMKMLFIENDEHVLNIDTMIGDQTTANHDVK